LIISTFSSTLSHFWRTLFLLGHLRQFLLFLYFQSQSLVTNSLRIHISISVAAELYLASWSAHILCPQVICLTGYQNKWGYPGKTLSILKILKIIVARVVAASVE
jgi:hypothetical protein